VELVGAIISEYKSVRHAEVPLGGLTVLCGPNSAGKTNLLEALGAHDPVARAALRRAGGLDETLRPRVGLVTRFDVTAAGTGPDAAALLEMIAAPWAANIPSADISEGIGAYCGSCWWLRGGDLYPAASRASLQAAYAAIRAALLASVPELQQDPAGQFLDLLFDKPVLIVQEDFAVELGCDRESAAGRQLAALSSRLEELSSRLEEVPDGVFEHLLGPFRDWTGRWPPLTLLTRGPGAEGTGAPAGFGWVAERLGGVQVVSGDVESAESHLDQALEQAHDRLQHRPDDDEPEMGDELCNVCLRADHGGRVDPAIYPPDNWAADQYEFPYPFQGSLSWLEERDAWVRLRPTLRDTLAVIEEQANNEAPSFVSEQGRIRLTARPVYEWDASPARCQIMFDVDPGDPVAEAADFGGRVGIAGFAYHVDARVLSVPLADLGAGLRRWVATAVRLAADACATGEISAVRWLGNQGDISEPPRVVKGESATPRILVVDEPEQHLHPHAQETIAAWAVQQARQHHAVVIASHSPAFLALSPEQATICLVQRAGHETHVQALPPVHGDDGVSRARRLGLELGLGREALAQLTRAVVVVEGEWDRQMLLHFYGPELGQQRVLIVPLQGSDELGAFADAAVIPVLGVPVVALLDEVRASSWEELAALPGTLSKAERCLRDLAAALGPWLQVVRYEDPDIICALPEHAVTAAYPEAKFPGWDDLLASWRSAVASQETAHSFKRWALEAMALPKKQRFPSTFFRSVLEHADSSIPNSRLGLVVEQVLNHVNAAR
jgi:hypothetical protein